LSSQYPIFREPTIEREHELSRPNANKGYDKKNIGAENKEFISFL